MSAHSDEFGRTIKRLRNLHDMNQIQLAKILNSEIAAYSSDDAGEVTQSAISYIESGKTNPRHIRIVIIWALAKVFGISLSKLSIIACFGGKFLEDEPYTPCKDNAEHKSC